MSDSSAAVRFSIKHMVCPRCIETVERLARESGLRPASVVLGELTLQEPGTAAAMATFRGKLEAAGFAFTETEGARLIQKVKTYIIERIHYGKGTPELNLSVELARHTACEYSRLSKLFSMTESITIERFAALLRVEKVKEMLSYGEQSIAEIAMDLGYSSPAHLSADFKKITGMTPSAFRQLGVRGRRGLDQISDA